MIGRTYLERGQPVVIMARWSGEKPVALSSAFVDISGPFGKPHGPRNVLIRRHTGEMVVRSFRGLRVASS